jgi:hypothetical protein
MCVSERGEWEREGRGACICPYSTTKGLVADP